MDNQFNGLSEAVESYSGPKICPLMSIGQNKPVQCVTGCAWFDTHEEGCAVLRIDAETNLSRERDAMDELYKYDPFKHQR